MRAFINLVRRSALLLVVILICVIALPASAAGKPKKTSTDSTESVSNTITQSYTADPSVQIGMIVALKTKDSTIVVPLKEDQIKSMLGVVIPASDAAIVLTPDDAKSQQVLVARAGRFNVVVSNQNGPIKIGDYVTISSVNGIGMKAGENEEQVVGKAASDFTGTSNVIGTVKLKDTTGKENNIALGRVMVDLKVSNNPLFQKSADYIPGFLSKVATTVANKPVSVARIYLCMALLVLSVAISSSMMYSGVRSGMIAVGRNPLSKKSIIKSLIQTLIAGLIVFVVGVLAVYLLLKL